ncbi:hypothetical protein NQL45_000404 [Klebsiella aerogenes]|nr:hypothetical protein [Klebsiella aerogenes]HBT4645278.1 hypothetical protein [Klebsiella aerogenes]
MNKLQTIADMLKLAKRLNAIVADMEERKQSMLAEMHKKAA